MSEKTPTKLLRIKGHKHLGPPFRAQPIKQNFNCSQTGALAAAAALQSVIIVTTNSEGKPKPPYCSSSEIRMSVSVVSLHQRQWFALQEIQNPRLNVPAKR